MAQQKQEQKQSSEPKGKYIVRICNTDLDGLKPVYHSLTKVKGIGKMYANAICAAAKINPFMKTGTLSEQQINTINEVIKNPLKFNIPTWLFNRRRDPIDGKDYHLLTSDLDFIQSNDIKMMQKIKCYKGIRHILGQPVRGQRTRSNFRKNKGKVVGVVKKSTVSVSSESKKDKDK